MRCHNSRWLAGVCRNLRIALKVTDAALHHSEKVKSKTHGPLCWFHGCSRNSQSCSVQENKRAPCCSNWEDLVDEQKQAGCTSGGVNRGACSPPPLSVWLRPEPLAALCGLTVHLLRGAKDGSAAMISANNRAPADCSLTAIKKFTPRQ